MEIRLLSPRPRRGLFFEFEPAGGVGVAITGSGKGEKLEMFHVEHFIIERIELAISTQIVGI